MSVAANSVDSIIYIRYFLMLTGNGKGFASFRNLIEYYTIFAQNDVMREAFFCGIFRLG
jgi:hypothetical protein